MRNASWMSSRMSHPDPKPSESVDPCVRALRRPPHRAQTGAVWHTPAGDHGFDAALPQQSAALVVVVVVVVGVRLPGSAARAAGRPSNVGNGVQQGHQLGVVAVAAGQRDGERGAVSVVDDMVLRAGPGAVDRARPGLGPPRRAWRCEPSITARDQSSFPARCSSVSSTWYSWSHTPTSCQSRSRRQQVIPEPKPSSCGSHSHWIPVCSTNRMPCRQRRSSSGSRPALRARRCLTGSSGPIRPHRSSDTTHGGPFPFPRPRSTSAQGRGHGFSGAFCQLLHGTRLGRDGLRVRGTGPCSMRGARCRAAARPAAASTYTSHLGPVGRIVPDAQSRCPQPPSRQRRPEQPPARVADV